MKHRHLRLTAPGVVAGVFSFYETEGLPLDDILSGLWQHEMIPCWVDLVCCMTRAGRPLERVFEALAGAVNDACYPPQVRDGILEGLSKLRQSIRRVP